MNTKGRILAIDYGKKRTGIAVTDELQIIASPLKTVQTEDLYDFLTSYCKEEKVVEIVVGLALRMSGEPSDIEIDIQKFIQSFQQKFPKIPIFREDESYTSKRAAESIYQSGAKKKKRQQKELLDKVSAAIILQSYLQHKI